jgi:hypothetical protein
MYLKKGLLGYGPGLFRSGYDSEELVWIFYSILDFLKNAGVHERRMRRTSSVTWRERCCNDALNWQNYIASIIYEWNLNTEHFMEYSWMRNACPRAIFPLLRQILLWVDYFRFAQWVSPLFAAWHGVRIAVLTPALFFPRVSLSPAPDNSQFLVLPSGSGHWCFLLSRLCKRIFRGLIPYYHIVDG